MVTRPASPDACSAPGGSLLAIPHEIQDEASYIANSVVAPLASTMNRWREVHSALMYYTSSGNLDHTTVLVRRSRKNM